jgi:hypothetical protein
MSTAARNARDAGVNGPQMDTQESVAQLHAERQLGLALSQSAHQQGAQGLFSHDAERNANEPMKVKLLRASPLKCPCVRKLFAPWYVDANTKNGQEPVPNMQKTSNETLHAHHLHVTVYEPKIL